jgi:hypothetical protein
MAQPRVQRPYGVSGALRKKLSALAISPAAPSGAQTTPHDATSPTSPIFGANAKKRLFGWMKRATGPSENNEVDRSSSDLYRPPTSDVDDGDYVTLDDAYEVNDKIDEVMRKVICQAGVDYECVFPLPRFEFWLFLFLSVALPHVGRDQCLCFDALDRFRENL